MASPAAMIETLESRYAHRLRVVAEELDQLKKRHKAKEQERDNLLRESAPVMRRARAAEIVDLSPGRVEQIVGGTG